ncbi:hypothetical protein BRCON_2252 [Candidatus Sumerlaea chitinivorans]|uniref:Uncharacterized protein n=1 Tax=Sumerlaea chitinivorans TaxID=2250252 RepID=A0A2Z4Y816_SUMC1|nr:hypothetical protein BRCON_2252 [Candidatus Sumerlaea chitinivorans]
MWKQVFSCGGTVKKGVEKRRRGELGNDLIRERAHPRLLPATGCGLRNGESG